ncbi:hypothetical protein ACIQU5_05135 [Streptomyces sp. NPDC090306]|uniref:hypothetical protein n=1 Tax=unclassified Streptomyces TaxID=2593676 RepID=UPI0036EDBAE8
MQDFGRLGPDEEEHVRTAHGNPRPGGFRRCLRDGCRRFQWWSDWRDGGSFPKKDDSA